MNGVPEAQSENIKFEMLLEAGRGWFEAFFQPKFFIKKEFHGKKRREERSERMIHSESMANKSNTSSFSSWATEYETKIFRKKKLWWMIYNLISASYISPLCLLLLLNWDIFFFTFRLWNGWKIRKHNKKKEFLNVKTQHNAQRETL
jgi:hypothetical protein